MTNKKNLRKTSKKKAACETVEIYPSDSVIENGSICDATINSSYDPFICEKAIGKWLLFNDGHKYRYRKQRNDFRCIRCRRSFIADNGEFPSVRIVRSLVAAGEVHNTRPPCTALSTSRPLNSTYQAVLNSLSGNYGGEGIFAASDKNDKNVRLDRQFNALPLQRYSQNDNDPYGADFDVNDDNEIENSEDSTQPSLCDTSEDNDERYYYDSDEFNFNEENEKWTDYVIHFEEPLEPYPLQDDYEEYSTNGCSAEDSDWSTSEEEEESI